MKKIMGFLIVIFMLPMFVFAASGDYQTLNLDEALTQENIEHDFSNYKESNDQVIIYLFRGNGCGFCRNFLTFLNSIVDEYGKYFRVVSFEVWGDSNNAALKEEVSTFLNYRSEGVPYIVIGDQVFPGYNNSFDDAIKEKIMSEYEKDEKDRYDVFAEMDKAQKEEANKGKVNYFLIIFCNLLFIISATAIVLAFVNTKHNELLDEIEEIREKLNIENENKVVKKQKSTK